MPKAPPANVSVDRSSVHQLEDSTSVNKKAKPSGATPPPETDEEALAQIRDLINRNRKSLHALAKL